MESEKYNVESDANKTIDQRKRLAVLLVEDESCFLPIWKLIFNELDQDIELHWAVSAKDAFQKLSESSQKKLNFDLVISDIFLSGDETGLELWKKCEETNILFLFCSGITENSFPKLFTSEQTIPGFIPKPIDSIKTISMLKTAFPVRPKAQKS